MRGLSVFLVLLTLRCERSEPRSAVTRRWQTLRGPALALAKLKLRFGVARSPGTSG